MNILLTGGLGFIGSHTAIILASEGHSVVIIDNLCNSQIKTLNILEVISRKKISFYEGDIRDAGLLKAIFRDHLIDCVIHFAGLKSVAESSYDPLKYFDNNVSGTINLIKAMQAEGVNMLVFSSSATVYGIPQYLPYDEKHPLAPMNVYGRTKLMVEEVLRDFKNANPSLKIALLRYFNPVGAHESGRIGENPFGAPNNLMPFISQVAVGRRDSLMVYGGDYQTPDGTALRDYIHVDDLAAGHVAALNFLSKGNAFITVNLGTGKPKSVLEVITAFEKASGIKIPYQIVGRRSGDLPEYYANASLAKQILGWEAKLDIDRMCADAWRWQKNNPMGH